MSADQHAQEELAHIGRMIAQLERVAESERRRCAHFPVMRREYWIRRIDALMDASAANGPLRRDAAALRERLAGALADTSRTRIEEAGKSTRETGSRT